MSQGAFRSKLVDQGFGLFNLRFRKIRRREQTAKATLHLIFGKQFHPPEQLDSPAKTKIPFFIPTGVAKPYFILETQLFFASPTR